MPTNGFEDHIYNKFYDYVNKSYLSNCLIYDKDSVNKLQLCTKYFANNDTTRIAHFTHFKSCKMKMRIKLPVNTTMQLFYSAVISGERQTKSFASITGTGDFTWYDFDFTLYDIDDSQYVAFSTNNANALFDVFYISSWE